MCCPQPRPGLECPGCPRGEVSGLQGQWAKKPPQLQNAGFVVKLAEAQRLGTEWQPHQGSGHVTGPRGPGGKRIMGECAPPGLGVTRTKATNGRDEDSDPGGQTRNTVTRGASPGPPAVATGAPTLTSATLMKLGGTCLGSEETTPPREKGCL